MVVLGDLMVDVVTRLDAELAVGSDAPARISMGGGGSAANVAAWLAHIDAPAVLVARIGADARGEAEAAALRAAGVEARLAVDRSRPTGTCVVLVTGDGQRSMLPDPGSNDALAPDDVPADVLERGGHLHVSGYALLREGSREAALTAMERARSSGMTVSVDPASAALLTPGFLELAAGADLLLPNADEAEALGGVEELAERFPELAVKLGPEGALWVGGDERMRAPAQPVNGPIDTTGAGDAFAAGLLAARLDGDGPAQALSAGCRLAARAVATPGARPAAR